jgi:hypothetical protein
MELRIRRLPPFSVPSLLLVVGGLGAGVLAEVGALPPNLALSFYTLAMCGIVLMLWAGGRGLFVARYRRRGTQEEPISQREPIARLQAAGRGPGGDAAAPRPRYEALCPPRRPRPVVLLAFLVLPGRPLAAIAPLASRRPIRSAGSSSSTGN